MAKYRSVGGASQQPAFMGICLIIRQMCLPCPPNGWIWLNIGAWWGREKCLVQRLEMGVCPRSVLDYGGGTKKSVNFETYHYYIAWRL